MRLIVPWFTRSINFRQQLLDFVDGMEGGPSKRSRRLYLEPENTGAKVPRCTSWRRAKIGNETEAAGGANATDRVIER